MAKPMRLRLNFLWELLEDVKAGRTAVRAGSVRVIWKQDPGEFRYHDDVSGVKGSGPVALDAANCRRDWRLI